MARSIESKTLQELERDDWGEPASDTHVVRTCHAIRRKKLSDLSVEELRLAIGQRMGLKYLLPIAVRHLSENPFVSGDYYPGDLFQSVLRVPRKDWGTDLSSLQSDFETLIERFFAAAGKMDLAWKEACLPEIRAASNAR